MISRDSAGLPLEAGGPPLERACTYQLMLVLPHLVSIQVGRLGRCVFPAGRYCYTGSARRGMESRLTRHLRRDKALRWHIDYLLATPGARVTSIRLSTDKECLVNQSLNGDILMPGFGASDCRQGCGSHLKYLGCL